MSRSRLSLCDIVANPACDVSADGDRRLHAERARSPDTVPETAQGRGKRKEGLPPRSGAVKLKGSLSGGMRWDGMGRRRPHAACVTTRHGPV